MTKLLIGPPRERPVRHRRALLILAALILAILAACGPSAACYVWTAADEPPYITAWQLAHCDTLIHRTIPAGEYNP